MYEYTLPDLITAFALGGSSGNTNVLPALSDSEHQKALRVAEQVAQGKRKITAISNGRIVLG
jgi:dihydrodipicolinate synthase/N-acetylneuraminate lyase